MVKAMLRLTAGTKLFFFFFLAVAAGTTTSARQMASANRAIEILFIGISPSVGGGPYP